jgi:membrane protease YdiL (CAAX protease family)
MENRLSNFLSNLMGQTPQEVITTVSAFIAFWLVMVIVILLAGRYIASIGGFRQRMVSQWKPALLATVLFVVSMGLGGSGWLNPYAIAIFCQAMIGLAVASSIPGFKPLPAVNAIQEHHNVFIQIALPLSIALLAVIPVVIIGTVGLSIGRQIFGETTNTQQAVSTLVHTNKWLVFFSLLGGAGIAEETTFRLVVHSLVWKLTGHKWLAIVGSALVFGAYHLSPLNSLYKIFWQFPISQFLASALIGLVWGYLFTKRGYGTAVLGHALSDWLPMMVFT